MSITFARPTLRVVASLLRAVWRGLNLALAKGWIVTRPVQARQMKARKRWVIGGSSGSYYGDNSGAVHAHLLKNYPEIEVFWVINKDSPDVQKVEAMGPVLFRDNWRTVAQVLLAEVVIISHGVHDAPGMTSHSCEALKVRLGHGLTALKKTKPRVLKSNGSANAVFDLVPVSSPFEAEIKKTWGVLAKNLVVTGLPRFDTLLELQRSVPANGNVVLYMPTWREDKSGVDALARAIDELIYSHELEHLLARYNARLHVVVHPILREMFKSLPRLEQGARLSVDSSICDPQRYFAEAGVLVTDYSSVCWDFLYLDKPVIFYQFDHPNFSRARGSYVGDTPLPGRVASSASELIAALESYFVGSMQSDSQLIHSVAAWKSRVFTFRDAGSCRRVVESILARLE